MNLTPKEYHLLKILNKYHNNTFEENLDDYHRFLDLLLYIHESLKEEQQEIKEWEKLSETLLLKFYFHGISMHQILSSIQLKSAYYQDINKVKYIDLASAKVVFRSKIEAFLMYYHIYINPVDDSMKELRYLAWIYTGLLQRQKLEATTDFAKEQKKKDLASIQEIRGKIQKLDAFHILTASQQKKLLEIGSGKLFSHWSSILKETGFKEHGHMETTYYLLSVYSHSEGLSAIQMSDASNTRIQIEKQASTDLFCAKLLVAKMITSLLSKYSVAQKRFELLPEEVQCEIEFYNLLCAEH